MNNLKHGIQPFWFWNGEMDDGEIRRQIGEMDEKGFKGFLIHPRQGMELPYLSEIYFEKVRTAVNEAKRRDMEVWLYDEFPYPSGVSGGKVTLAHPEYSCLELNQESSVFHGGETAKLYAPWGKVVMARAYRMKNEVCDWQDFIDLKAYVGSGYRQDVFQMSGLTQYNKKRYFQGELSQYLYWQVPEGTWKIYLYTESVMRHFKYFETFIDPLNPAAVRCFLDTTHEEYKKHLGDAFGDTIRGVFTDEVTAFPPEFPWSALLPGLVKEQSGLDLTEYLPALTEDMGEITAAVRYAYWNAATEQFIKSWDMQVYDWCEKNNLLYIGEKPILRSKELQYTHVPGIDAGHQKLGSRAALAGWKYRANGKIASSAAHFYRKPAALCEAFHSIGWGMTMQDCKWIFDWLTVMGIDWFITHGAYYTTDALKKHDAPPSFFYQMPWWKDVPQLTEYVARLNRFLTDGERQVPVLLVDPVTSTWTETGERAAKLKEDFAAFQNMLLRRGIDYYVIDPQLFAGGWVQKDGNKVNFCIGEDAFSTVILPFMTNLESDAVRMAQRYFKSGGCLVSVGTLFRRSFDGKVDTGWLTKHLELAPAKVEEQYFSGADVPDARKENGFYFGGAETAVKWLAKRAEDGPGFHVTAEGGDVVQIRKKSPEGEEQLFLANLSAEKAAVVIRLDGKEERRTIEGGASLFLVASEFAKSRKEQKISVFWDPAEELPMYAEGPNALRIGQWKLRLKDDEKEWVHAESFPMIDQLEDAGVKIPIRQKNYFGCPKELEFPLMEASYSYTFQNQTKKGTKILLMMEPGTLLGEWSLSLNSKKIYTESDFKRQNVYLATNLAVDVTDALTEGENCLRLEMKTDRSFGGIRNPLYLCGDFAVERKDGADVLLPAKTKGCMKDLSDCGLPFYAGRVSFEKSLPESLLKELHSANPDAAVQILRKDTQFHEALRIQAGTADPVIRAYAPYDVTVTAGQLLEDPVIRIELDTTLSRLFEGEQFDEEKHAYRPVL